MIVALLYCNHMLLYLVWIRVVHWQHNIVAAI